jgi:polysaccharide export outer membrane protein
MVFIKHPKDIVLLASAWMLIAASFPALGQTGASIPSSLDVSAQVTSRGPHFTPSPSGPVALPDDFNKLRLAPGHILDMSVFDAPEMSARLSVDDSGDVVVPLGGPIHVDGDSLREAEGKIAQLLVAKQIMNQPQVILEIAAYSPHSVLVAGEVQQPGRVPTLAPRPLLDLLAAAGGVTTAAGGDIEIHHPVTGAADEVRHIPYANGNDPAEARAALVAPGDSVFVRRAGVIYVLGAVQRPGGYLMVNGGTLTLPQAIALASGLTPVAAAQKTLIVRKHGNEIIEVRPQLEKIQRGELPAPLLQDGDMIYVPNSKIKSILINSSTVISSATSAAIYTVAR